MRTRLAPIPLTDPLETMNDKTQKAPEAKQLRREYVRVPQGRMVHMLTNQEITTKPVKMDIDFWLQAQIDAGKVLVGELD